MKSPEIEVQTNPVGKSGKAHVTVSLDNKILSVDDLKLTNEKAREKYLANLTEKYPQIPETDLRDALEKKASELAKSDERPAEDKQPVTSKYRSTPGGLIWDKVTADGPLPTQLTNFGAKIVEELVLDNGVETRRVFTIEATVDGRSARFDIPAERFQSMSWVTDNLGSRAILSAGLGTKDHTRAAIQALSDRVEPCRVYTHSGWRKVDGEWLFLHSNGSIGPIGPITDIRVRLPDNLSSVAIPSPPVARFRRGYIKVVLELLELGPEHIMFPLVSATFRAVLGNSDFSVHLTGETGTFKTTIAALFQSFFGKKLTDRNLPGSWSSTDNSIEALGFFAKDMIVVVDDFAPRGSATDIRRYHSKADRVFRAKGNNSGRGRCHIDGFPKGGLPPRCVYLSTGEEVPTGHSGQARVVILELTNGDVAKAVLTKCQTDSLSGKYARAMAGFIQWVAPQLDDIRRRIKERIPELRDEISEDSQHSRTAPNMAQLVFGFEQFLKYAIEAEAVDQREAKRLKARCIAAMKKIAMLQSHHHADSEITGLFVRFIIAALSSGAAYIANMGGNVPKEHAMSLGWRLTEYKTWEPQGRRIGWTDDEGIYLNPGEFQDSCRLFRFSFLRYPAFLCICLFAVTKFSGSSGLR